MREGKRWSDADYNISVQTTMALARRWVENMSATRKRLFCSCTDVEAERSHQPSAYNQRVRGRMEGGLVGLLAASIVFGVLLWVAFDTVAPEEAR